MSNCQCGGDDHKKCKCDDKKVKKLLTPKEKRKQELIKRLKGIDHEANKRFLKKAVSNNEAIAKRNSFKVVK